MLLLLIVVLLVVVILYPARYRRVWGPGPLVDVVYIIVLVLVIWLVLSLFGGVARPF
jgi:hypothetical protein